MPSHSHSTRLRLYSGMLTIPWASGIRVLIDSHHKSIRIPRAYIFAPLILETISYSGVVDETAIIYDSSIHGRSLRYELLLSDHPSYSHNKTTLISLEAHTVALFNRPRLLVDFVLVAESVYSARGLRYP